VHEEPDVITVAANVNAIAKVSYVFQYFVYHKPLFVARLLKSWLAAIARTAGAW
jgi:hypothetical protein